MLNRNRARGALATIVAAVVLPLALAGCSTSAASSDTASDATSSSAAGIGARWGACMRDAGLDVEDPSDALVRSGTVVAPSGTDPERFSTAAQTCSERLGVERQDRSERDEWARQYDQVASCIRENGYEDFPEQQSGTIDTSPEHYPRAAEEHFQQTFDECLHEYSPDTQFQQAG